MKVIAIDIGATNTRIALVEKQEIIKLKKFSTKQDFSSEISGIVNIIHEFSKDVRQIGISAPGIADYQMGLFQKLPNLAKWEGCNIITSLKEHFQGAKIKMQNDANMMALAHHHYFKNQSGITQFFTISTGFGAGLIIDNKIFVGSTGQAQEIANLPIAFSDESGKSLGAGSLEYFASGSGIALRAQMDTEKAFSLYGKEDKVTNVIDEAIDALANTIAAFVAIINPSLIVFDGAVARHNKWYVKKAIEIAKKRAFAAQFAGLKIEFSALGDDAALIGASIFAKEDYEKNY